MGRRQAPVRVPSAGGSHRSHQGEIWADIQGLQEVAGVASRTHAMHDVYSERQEKLAGVERAFQRLDGQVGGVFMVDGKVVGLEVVSRPEVYADVHAKLVRSYALEALLRRTTEAPAEAQPALRAFLERLPECTSEAFPAVGAGQDLRMEGNGMLGSALAVDGHPVHMALFASEGGGGTEPWVRRARGLFRHEVLPGGRVG